jgi:hypothetical protein
MFWKITPCSPLQVNRRFGRTYRLHLQVRRISQARNKHEAGGKICLRRDCSSLKMEENIPQKRFPVDYTALYPKLFITAAVRTLYSTEF